MFFYLNILIASSDKHLDFCNHVWVDGSQRKEWQPEKVKLTPIKRYFLKWFVKFCFHKNVDCQCCKLYSWIININIKRTHLFIPVLQCDRVPVDQHAEHCSSTPAKDGLQVQRYRWDCQPQASHGLGGGIQHKPKRTTGTSPPDLNKTNIRAVLSGRLSI